MTLNILKNKNCFITGATGGLGIEISKKLAQKNCNLFLTSKNSIKLENLKKIISKQNNNIKIYYQSGDLNNLKDIKKILSESQKHFKKIDILINNAGIFPVKKLSKSNFNDYDSCFNVNIRAPFLFSKELSENMIKHNWGRIVNIGSSSSYSGFKNTSLYCASKHALLGFSRSLHEELKNNNIRVISISPGSIKTKMGRKVKNQDFKTFLNPEEIAESLIHLISLNDKMIVDEIRLNRIDVQ